MNFKVRKIHQGESKNKLWRKVTALLGPKGARILVVLIAVSALLWGGKALLQSDFFSEKATRILPKLSGLQQGDEGHTNIVLLGVAGKDQEGGNLSDSLMVLSVNPKVPSVSFLSLPRDLFVTSSIGDYKVNEIYARARNKALAPHVEEGVTSINELSPEVIKQAEFEGLQVIKDSLADFTGIPIHYGAIVNFKVFEEIIDAMDGLEIFVQKDIVDPFYPDVNYGYQTFTIRKGLQTIDGATALKYARSRKTSSDYDRAQRQQDLLLALRKQALNKSLLTDFEKLKDFYRTYTKNITTDLGVTEMIALAKIGVSIDYTNALSAVLNDDPTQKGGFLYTPAKEFYGGQFVLLPKNRRDTQKFMDMVLIHPEILLEKAQISILNGSKISGLAGTMNARLRRMGFHIIEVGNADNDKPTPRSTITDLKSGEKTKTLETLSKFLDLKVIPQDPTAVTTDDLIDLQIILGTN